MADKDEEVKLPDIHTERPVISQLMIDFEKMAEGLDPDKELDEISKDDFESPP
jgi:hypothetical protein